MAKSEFVISKMDCPTEEQIIRNGLRQVQGVQSLTFDLVNRRLKVEHSLESDHAIVQALTAVGMAPDGTDEKKDRRAWIAGAALALALTAEAVSFAADHEASLLSNALAVAAIALGGFSVLKKALVSVRTFTLNINFLMALATVGAIAIGELGEAAMVIVLFSIAELIESHSLDRARNATRSLMDMTPEVALVMDAEGRFAEVHAHAVSVGDTVRVRPGERVPFDGEIVAGRSDVDQSSITGESMPAAKEVGDVVFAGTLNGRGSFDFRVEHTHGETTLDRIISTIQTAQAERAPVQRIVDQFARWYTPVIVALAVIVATVPPLVAGDWHGWLYKALVLLVVACPCALVISTPVTLVSALTRAARMGILIKGGAHLERARLVQHVALDKTGTLTQGRPSVVAVEPLGRFSAEDCLAIAAAVEARSEHPVAQAIVQSSVERKSATDFVSHPGRGAEANVEGVRYRIGNHRWIHEHDLCSEVLEARLTEHEVKGQTVVVLWDDSGPLAIVAVADALRPSSAKAINALHGLNITTHLLTGDNATTARAIASQAGIANQHSEMLPEDKLRWIADMSERGHHVAMVGDGVNDSPALARADLGIAMGAAGTDAAIETADVALMDDDLSALPTLFQLSRATWAILWQNVLGSILIKLAFIVLDFTGHANLWMAVFADMGVSLLVVFNGLRLLRFKPRA